MTVGVKKGWDNPPPVVVLSGAEDFLRGRELRKAIAGSEATGRRIERVDGSDTEALSDLLSESLVFGTPVLAVVSNPGKLDADLVASHQATKDNTVCLLLHHDGNVRKGSALDKLADIVPKKFRLAFPKEDRKHKIREVAARFVVSEAQSMGKEMDYPIAEALVDKVGTDFGTLHFEILKASVHAESNGNPDRITAGNVKATMLRTGAAEYSRLVDAVGIASPRHVLKEMDTLRDNAPGAESERTLTACAWLGNQVIQWLHAQALDAQGASESEMGSRMKPPPYVIKTFILPVARRWGRPHLIRLVKRLSKVESAVKRGHIAPWTELECALVASCRSVSSPG